MIKFSYRTATGVIKEVTFDKYYEMLRYVAINRIADEAFVSMNLNAEDENSKTIVGLDGLVEKALETADKMEEAEAQLEAMMAAMENSEDDEYDEFEEDF